MTIQTRPAVTADTDILAMERQYRQLLTIDDTDPELQDSASEQAEALCWLIADTPAEGPDGLAVKVRILQDSARTGNAVWDEAVCDSLLADIAALLR